MATAFTGELSCESFVFGGVCLSIDLTDGGVVFKTRGLQTVIEVTVDRVVGVVVDSGDAAVTAVEDDGRAEEDGGLSVESKNDADCWRLNMVDEQPFIFKPSFSAICTEVGVERAGCCDV